MGKDENYFASITATVFLSLHHLGVMEPNHYAEFYETLFWLRDNSVEPQPIAKRPEDMPAWDVQESASVWSTNVVLWAFLGTGYSGDRLEEIKEALFWLIRQQRVDGGWGFDIQTESSIFFTAPALHVTKLALSSKIKLTSEEKKEILRSRAFGIDFVLKNYYQESSLAYGKLHIHDQESDDPTATLLAMWVLYDENKEKYKDKITGGYKYLHEKMDQGIWGFKEVVAETRDSTKYGCFKIYKSFSPAFVIFLLRSGCSPYDDLCIGPITWFDHNKLSNGWPLPGYRDGGAFTFSTAYALWAINNWNKYVVKENHHLIKQNNAFQKPVGSIDDYKKIRVTIQRQKIGILGLGAIAGIELMALIALNLPIAQWVTPLITQLVQINSYIDAFVTFFTFLGIVWGIFKGIPWVIKKIRDFIKDTN